jgi:hypothetical protein
MALLLAKGSEALKVDAQVAQFLGTLRYGDSCATTHFELLHAEAAFSVDRGVDRIG